MEKKAVSLGASYLIFKKAGRGVILFCFETKSHYVARAVLELTVVRLASNSSYTCLCLPGADNTGTYQHTLQ